MNKDKFIIHKFQSYHPSQVEIKYANGRSSTSLTPDTEKLMNFGEKIQLSHIREGLASAEKYKAPVEQNSPEGLEVWGIGRKGKAVVKCPVEGLQAE